jgi:capsular polysaccharide biosynthesis protein
MSVLSPDPSLSQPEPDRRGQDRLYSTRRPSPGEALSSHPLVVLVPAVIFAVLGGLLGFHASTTYTASAQLVVQPLAPTVSQLPSAVQAAEDQATNESRLVLSSGVTIPLAREFNTTPTDIAKRISATPIPTSTVITLDAEADSAHGAVTLANAAAATFAHYVNAELQSTATTEAVLKRYEVSEVLLDQARNARLALETKHVGLNGLVRATAAVAAAQVRATALSDQYQTGIQALATAPAVKPFSSATKASSNRRSQLELYVLGGLLIGLLLGAAAAILLANRRFAATTAKS